MPPSNRRQRELARAKAARQAERRAQQQRRRRTRNVVTTGGVVLLVVAVVAVLVLSGQSRTTNTPVAIPTASGATAAAATASATADDRTVACGGTDHVVNADPDQITKSNEPPLDTDMRSYTMTLATSCGTVTVTLDGAKANRTVNSLRFLAGEKYFDGTPCHRLVTSGIFVLQCGDPSGTGTGGPGYTIPEENLTGATYPKGTMAMANAGTGTTGSQFFLVTADTTLPASYTPVGTVSGGLDVLAQLAAVGTSATSGDGPPAQKIFLDTVTIS